MCPSWIECPRPYVLGPAGTRQRERLLRIVLRAAADGVQVGPELEDRLGLSARELYFLAFELEAQGQIRTSLRLPEARRARLPLDPLERLCMERAGCELFLFPRHGAARPREREMPAARDSTYRFVREKAKEGRASGEGADRGEIHGALRHVAAACGAEAALYVRDADGLGPRACRRARRKLSRAVAGDACVVVVLDVRGRSGSLEAAVDLAAGVRRRGYARAIALNAAGASILAVLGLHEWAIHPEACLGPLAGVRLEAAAGITPEARVARELAGFGWPDAAAHRCAKALIGAERPLALRDLAGFEGGGPAPSAAELKALDALLRASPDGPAVVAMRA